MQHELETLLGCALPVGAGPAYYQKISPSAQLHYHYVLARLDGMDLAAYEALVSSAPAFRDPAPGYLPAAWRPAEAAGVDWWTPTLTTPAHAVAAAYGQQGWIVAKFEAGKVFLLATDH